MKNYDIYSHIIICRVSSITQLRTIASLKSFPDTETDTASASNDRLINIVCFHNVALKLD